VGPEAVVFGGDVVVVVLATVEVGAVLLVVEVDESISEVVVCCLCRVGAAVVRGGDAEWVGGVLLPHAASALPTIARRATVNGRLGVAKPPCRDNTETDDQRKEQELLHGVQAYRPGADP
jgi:hypothetical protein